MATLSAADLAAIIKEFGSDVSARRASFSVSRPDLSAAVTAIDAWADSAAGAFNNAIPQPARSQLATREKAELLSRVLRKRFEVS